MMTAQAMAPAPPFAKPAVAVDFSALVAAEQAALLRLAQRFVREPEEARDLVQSTFADAYERLHHLRDPLAAAGWLRRILVTRALNQLRRRRVWGRVRSALGIDPELPAPMSAAQMPDQLLFRKIRMEALFRAMEKLPARQSAAFTLRYLEGLDLCEVAAALGVGKGTVKTHLHRALTALRGQLDDGEGDGS